MKSSEQQSGARICILRTDEVLAEFQPEFGDYPQMFARVLRQVEPALQLDVVDARKQLPGSVESDAYLITGSRHSVYEPLPWIGPLVEFLQQVLDAGKKIIGICFGHQLMAHFFGGAVGPAPQGWGVGVQVSNVCQRKAWMSGGYVSAQTDRLGLLSSHKDQVLEVPAQAEVYLSSDFCPVAGFTLGSQVITVQGHPEFSREYAGALMTRRREMLGERTYREGMNSLSEAVDPDTAVGWMLNFLQLPVSGRAAP